MKSSSQYIRHHRLDYCVGLWATMCLAIPSGALAQPSPPMYNARIVSGSDCYYSDSGFACGTEGRCDPIIDPAGWPCTDCNWPDAAWPLFAQLFYSHHSNCTSVEFHELPLVDFPTGVFEGGNSGLVPDYSISISPIDAVDIPGGTSGAGLNCIREVPLECSPARFPATSAARYKLELSGFGSSANHYGAIFFVTAEFNPSLFDVTLYGRIRSSGSYSCGSTPIEPFHPRLIVGQEISAGSDVLRYADLISAPEYVKVAMKPGRSVREVGNESVKLRVHTFNWGGDSDFFCLTFGNCDEGFRFQQNGSVNVQVISLELPPNWCRDAEPLAAEDALPVSTLSPEQRQSAEFDGIGAKVFNDLTVDLPTMRVGHNRFRCGRTLSESLGNEAYWHTEFCNDFVSFNQFGVWCAVDDLSGWTFAQVSDELVVTDPCEGLTYHFKDPAGTSNLGQKTLKLAVVKRGGNTIRTYDYSGSGVDGTLESQTDSSGNDIAYNFSTIGTDTQLTITGSESGGGDRTITAVFSEAGFLKSATWSNGGPARQYEYTLGAGGAQDGRIDRVLDAAGNVLLDFTYDSFGRLIETTRGSGGTFQVLNRHTYFNTEGNQQILGNTCMVSQCFVDDTQYQATVRTFDEFNRVTRVEESHDLQTVDVVAGTCGDLPAFTGTSSVTETKYRETDLGVGGGFFTVEVDLPAGTAADYTVYDSNFNALRTFMAEANLSDVSSGTLIKEKRFTNGQFAGVWQTTSETDVARDNATTTMDYDSGSGFLTSRTMPSISAGNSGSGSAIDGYEETFTYDSVNKKRIVSETRLDGQANIIDITNTFDSFDYPASREEDGACDIQTIGMDYNAFGQEIQRTDVDGFVTVKVYDQSGHPNDGSGLLLGQHTFASGSSGAVLQQIRYTYYTSGSSRGRLEKIEIADHDGSFTLGSPSGWQVTTFAYDAYGRVQTKTTTHTTKPGTFVWTYAYDVQDRVKQIAYPDGEWVRTARDSRGMVINEYVGSGGTLTNGTGGTVVLTNTYEYDDNGDLIDRLNQSAANMPDHTTYAYDPFRRRTSKTDVDVGSVVGYDIITAYEYNAGIDVIRETVQEGASGPLRVDIRRDFDELGRVWQERILAAPGTVNNNVDRITTTTFDVRGNEVATKVADTSVGDALTTRAFTCFDHPASMTVTLNGSETAVTEYETDRRGNIEVVTDPVLNRTEHGYDAVNRRVESRYFERIGGSDVLQMREDSVYTSRDQRAKRTQFNASSAALDQHRWEYNTLGFQSRHARMADPASTSAVSTSTDMVTNITYDGVGRTLTRTTYDAGTARTTTFGYDAIGRMDSITHPVTGNSEALAYYTNTTRLQTRTITDEIGSRDMTTVFDPFGRLMSETAEAISPATDVRTSYEYDAANRRVQITDPAGIITINGYDGIGQLTSVVEDSGGANERTVTFTFTQKGDPLTVVADDGEGPQTTTYQHDRAGRRTRITHPGGAFAQFAYDAAGRMQTRTAEDSFVTFYTHNWRGQAVQKRQTNGSGTILEEFAYDPLGRMTAAAVGAISTSQYKTTYLYGNGTDVDGDSVADPAFTDEPAAETQTVAGVVKAIHHRRNTAGERSRLVYPEGADTTLDFGYDKFGQVKSIDRNSARLANYGYAGRFVTSRQVRTTATGTEKWIELVWTRPDQLRRPATITNQLRTGSTGGSGGTVTARVGYTNVYNAASELDTQTVANHPISAENGTHDHGYDRLHRLTATNYPNTSNDESWTLDDLGNWVSHTDRSAATTTYTDNVLNQYSAISGQAVAPLHDAKGNLVRNERGYGFTYDFENRLTRVFEDNAPSNGTYDSGEAVFAEYVVDPMGRRVKAATASATGTLNTSFRYYDDLLVVAEYDSSNSSQPTVVFVHGPTYTDEHLLIRHVSSFGDVFEGYYLLKDLYTVAAIVDADGNYLQSYAYTGYGLPTTIDLTTNGGCLPGDLDGDLTIDMADIPQFLTVLLEGPGGPDALHEWCASDLNGDGLRDGEDVQPFVNCLINSGSCSPAQASIANPFFFTGQRLDRFNAGDLLLYDYKARVVDPKHGRFQQRDPSEFTDAYNLYEYVLSQPSAFVDPTGREFTILGLNVSVAIRKGLTALNAYTAVAKGKQLVKALVTGVGVQQVLTSIILDAAFDRLGGKLFDVALRALNRFRGLFGFKGGIITKLIGDIGEARVGLSGTKVRINSSTGTASYRVLDDLDEAAGIVREIKNRAELDLTNQIVDVLHFSIEKGYAFELVVRKGTTLSGPLQALVDAGFIILRREL